MSNPRHVEKWGCQITKFHQEIFKDLDPWAWKPRSPGGQKKKDGDDSAAGGVMLRRGTSAFRIHFAQGMHHHSLSSDRGPLVSGGWDTTQVYRDSDKPWNQDLGTWTPEEWRKLIFTENRHFGGSPHLGRDIQTEHFTSIFPAWKL